MVMMSLRKPSPPVLRGFLEREAQKEFSYPEVGATATTPPSGYVVDRTHLELGMGESIFLAARNALEHWQQFPSGWVDLWPRTAPLEPGQVVAIMGWSAGCWWLNACRIVYTVDESSDVARFGFANGTLPGHVQSGEERFLIEWDRATNRVCYDILAFSRPHHFSAKLGYPVVRRCQKRFGRESAEALFRAVNATSPLPKVFQSMNRVGQTEACLTITQSHKARQP